MNPNPTLYDILGVPEDASADQIKRAWRDAAERFEPGSGGSAAQFRLFNEAAEVLLDPERRREYDAQLESTAAPVEAGTDEAIEPAGTEEAGEGWTVPVPAGAESGAETPARRPVPLGWTVGLGALAVVLVVFAAVYGIPRWKDVRHADKVDEATSTAPAVAERAATTILSYDYKSLGTDEKAAQNYMTGSYARKYTHTFDKLVRPHAPELKAHVVADVKASGVIHADPDRVAVLLFVNQVTTSTANGGKPQTALNRVELKMKHTGGRWLVDGITSY
ncbi:MAG TPA: J domain-containing protein [Nocardioidaceae bacterium]|nr:J domain-containing protein [Nocardioidaceae bacterium]